MNLDALVDDYNFDFKADLINYNGIDYDFCFLENDSELDNIPNVTIKPPAPKPKAKKYLNTEDEEYYELLENSKQCSKYPFDRLDLNLALELQKKFNDFAFSDCTKKSHCVSNLNFIVKRKSWGKSLPKSFNCTKTGGNMFCLQYTPYMKQQEILIDQCSDYLESLNNNKFSVPLIVKSLPLLISSNKNKEATDMVLRLVYIIQQALPNMFMIGASKFIENNELRMFNKVIYTIAKYSFDIGCYSTSTTFFKLGMFLTINDSFGFARFAAISALYGNDLNFLSLLISSDMTSQGIPLHAIPQWPIAEALLMSNEHNTEPIEYEIDHFPYIFRNIETEMPDKLKCVVIQARNDLYKYFLTHEDKKLLVEKCLSKPVSNDFKEIIQYTINFWNKKHEI